MLGTQTLTGPHPLGSQCPPALERRWGQERKERKQVGPGKKGKKGFKQGSGPTSVQVGLEGRAR